MPPHLTSARLALRPFTEQDIDPAYRIFEGHPDVYQYDPGFQRTYEQRAELIRRYARENDAHGAGNLAVLFQGTGNLIGYCGLQLYILPREPLATPEVELFYKLGREYWGQGYAAEACRAVLCYAFEEIRLTRTVSCVLRENQASIRLLERLGARIEDAPPTWNNMLTGTIERDVFLASQAGGTPGA